MLESMEPDPTWNAALHEETVATFRAAREDLSILIWGGDWCGDTRSELPGLAAVLRAAGIGADSVEIYPVEKAADGSKRGPHVAAYDIDRVPTIIVKLDGQEIARFVESEDVPAAEYLAAKLEEAKTPL